MRGRGFHAAVQQAGNATLDDRGMSADATFEDLVRYNDGSGTRWIGIPEQIANRVAAYRVLAVMREIEESEEDSVHEYVPASW